MSVISDIFFSFMIIIIINILRLREHDFAPLQQPTAASTCARTTQFLQTYIQTHHKLKMSGYLSLSFVLLLCMYQQAVGPT